VSAKKMKVCFVWLFKFFLKGAQLASLGFGQNFFESLQVTFCRLAMGGLFSTKVSSEK
jgi:hypothetical protein